MSRSLGERQHAVKKNERPPRTSEGDLFTGLVVAIAQLGGRVSAIGEELAGVSGLSLARWVVLDMAMDAPATVAQIARGRGMARQSVQRVADLLVAEGLAEYQANPEHKRAKLICPTDEGRLAIAEIAVAQKQWADRVGTELGAADLRQTQELIEKVQEAVTDSPTE
ncbi:MarR family winged helix-turn-helix transcriptional regulator [Ruania zhangjianzhongii]|uniref:MarR family winged helix-turn-helix transcriptional regulator n=1 Tax=Ruania zhangjianzhongii TaxID=2603206 RepID=UPI0011C81476|nr:MarR family transcriptional regulator [Ruania zhangjianzhongii]